MNQLVVKKKLQRQSKDRDPIRVYKNYLFAYLQDNSLDPRTKSILELVDTEDDYVKDLEIIKDVRIFIECSNEQLFMEGMKRENLATPQEIQNIFGSKNSLQLY